MDNLNTNDAMMRRISRILKKREISFEAEHNRIMCFPHIINIILQHILKKMTLGDDISDDENSGVPDSFSDEELADTNRDNADDSSTVEEGIPIDERARGQTFRDACSEDPIGRLRKLISKLRSSGQRRDDFINWIKDGNEKSRFNIKGKVVKVPHKELLRDVATRWDSTYQMLKRSIELRPVCVHLSFSLSIFTMTYLPGN
jgi:hypothetical protein